MPVAPLPIVNPVFRPALQTIASITNALAAIITTDLPHNYIDGLFVRLDIPPEFGMQQANGIEGAIAVLNATQFVMTVIGPNGENPLDTTNFDAFTVPVVITTPAQVVPTGELNKTLLNATKNVLPL